MKVACEPETGIASCWLIQARYPALVTALMDSSVGPKVAWVRNRGAAAGVAEARQDVAVVVQPLVDGAGPDADRRVVALEFREALRRGQQAGHADLPRPGLLPPVDRGDGGVAGGQHGVDDDHRAVGEVL